MRAAWVWAALLVVGCGGDEVVGPGGGGAGGDVDASVSPDAPAVVDSSQTADIADGGEDGGPPDVAPSDVPVSDVADVPVPIDDGDAGPPLCPAGSPCDDLDPCTFDDQCDGEGGCAGTAAPCDDGLTCTEETCDGTGGCTTVVAAGCLIDGACVAGGEASPETPCLECAPEDSATQWSAPAGGECTDGDACTLEECLGGVCTVMGAAVCDDANPCTVDTCDSAVGCEHAAADGPCDDGSSCTSGDACAGSVCVGTPIVCKDGVSCTTDGCDPTSGCHFAPSDELCEDGEPCTLDLCDPGVGCLSTPVDLFCDDGAPCTDDLCNPLLGCSAAPVPGCVPDEPCDTVADCDDGIACTTDGCAPDKGCSHVADEAACTDGDPCTLDLCDAKSGCTHLPGGNAPCEDGDACTGPDTCVTGSCTPGPDTCGCTPKTSPVVHRAIKLAIGESGTPGQGLDVDGDPGTCAPFGCSDGVDNALSILSALANDALTNAVDAGTLVTLLDPVTPDMTGKPFALTVLAGALDPTAPACAKGAPGCAVIVSGSSFDDECNPLILFDNAKIASGKLTAGGGGYQLAFAIPLGEGGALLITLHRARIEATVKLSGGQIQTIDGVIGGAVPKAELLGAISALPDDALPEGITKEQAAGLLESLVTNDIDSDGDGTLDAASIGLLVKTVPAQATGIE